MRIFKFFVILIAVFITATSAVFKITSDGSNVAPTITCKTNDTIIATVNCTDEELLSYVTASDAQDGDLTKNIVLTRKMFFVAPKTTLVIFSVSDSDNNVATLQKKVYFEDYSSPKISLLNDFIFPSGLNFDLGDYVSAECMIDGDLSDYVKIISTDKYSTSDGSYNILIKVTNSMADSTEINVTAFVTNKDYGLYRIRLENYITYTPVGVTPDYKANLKSVINKGNTEYTVEDVKIDDSAVDLSKPGCYDVFYNIYDNTNPDSTEAISMSRMVVVVEEVN